MTHIKYACKICNKHVTQYAQKAFAHWDGHFEYSMAPTYAKAWLNRAYTEVVSQ